MREAGAVACSGGRVVDVNALEIADGAIREV
jgi:hypothetical protein